MDRITNLPDNLIENILGRLSLCDAIRMSVLSREWKLKWVTLPKLALDSTHYESYDKFSKVFNLEVVKTIFRQHIGPILELSVHLPALNLLEREKLADECISLLSSHGVKKLILHNLGYYPVNSLSHDFYFCFQLNHLELKGNFEFDPPPTFSGFPNLATLSFDSLDYPLDRISSLISNSPKLQSVTLKNFMKPLENLHISAARLEYLHVYGVFNSISLQEAHNVTTMILDCVDAKLKSSIHPFPYDILSCVQLTHLEIRLHCKFDPPSTFSGFPNLTTLIFDSIECPLDTISSLISNSQQLRNLKLTNFVNLNDHLHIHAPRLEHLDVHGEFRSLCLHEINNAITVGVHLVDLHRSSDHATKCNMTNLFKNLGKIKYLSMGGYMCKILGAGGDVPNKLSTSFDGVTTLKMELVALNDIDELTSALCLIASFPNLSKLEITIFQIDNVGEEPLLISAVEKYADCCLNNLRTVKFCNILGIKPELKVIEILLGCSPVLEEMSIGLQEDVSDENFLIVFKELEQFHRASQNVNVIVDSVHVKFSGLSVLFSLF